ncbi:MAG: SGNH/GDSL hydrolase family protein [Bacteroides sp.]|nr:SGNH/GDSL hydrolase family protein [Bacteroides sp.]
MNRRKSLKIIGSFGLASFLPASLLGEILNKGCEVCKDAWTKLSKFTARRYQFRYIEPKAALPKVFIYGDSISIGYTEYVRASLEGNALVYRLHVNGGSSNDFIARMETLRKAMFQPDLEQGWDFQWDLIHFNVGLHDLKYIAQGKLDKENGKQVTSLDKYADNLRSIIDYLKSTYPDAKLIFASTTPVPEGEAGRIAGDAKRYNKAARKVVKKHRDIGYNDLYKFAEPVLEEHAAGPGNVHFNSEGSRLLGIEVADVIAEAMEIETVPCPSAEVITERASQYEAKNTSS